jgi:hypothetical protein
MMNLPYTTSQETAVAMIGKWKRAGKALCPLPYNRFAIEDASIWWLMPERRLVGFRYGKCCFSTHEFHAAPGEIFCGLNVEKGIESDFVEDRFRLRKDWTWFTFIEQMEKMGALVQRASKVIKSRLTVLVLSFAYGYQGFRDRISFTTEGDKLEVETSSTGAYVLGSLCGVADWKGLSGALRCLPTEAQGYWVDIHVGTKFSLKAGGKDDSLACFKMLRAFSEWLR